MTARAKALLLSPEDNVAVAIADIAAGETIEIADLKLAAQDEIPLGHKMAIIEITSGTKVRKFGVPIGSATALIRAGCHVHVHNIKSDYLTNDVDHFE
jgi:hypothetical protein